MKYQTYRKTILIVLVLLYNLNIFSQGFSWETKLDKVESKGFYLIKLNNNILSKLNSDFSDIRIYDEENKEVAYILKKEKPIKQITLFKEYKIIEKKHKIAWGYTRIIIHNPKKNDINNILFIIKNTEVKKRLKFSGSDDKENWYIIKDKYRFQSSYSENDNSVIKILNFPKSNYEYYEILLDDYVNKPINILKVGYLDTSIENGKYSEISSVDFLQNDSLEPKKTIVKIKFDEPKYVDKITFKIGDNEFFHRNATISVKDSAKYKKKKMEYFYTDLKNFTITSYTDNTILLENQKMDKFYFIIENNDNQPLLLKDVKVYHLNTSLVAKLDNEKKYKIKFGNSKISKAKYDLEHFIDSIPKGLKNVNTKELIKIEIPKEEKKELIDTTIIWLAIALVVFLLGFLSFKMINDMNKKKEDKN